MIKYGWIEVVVWTRQDINKANTRNSNCQPMYYNYGQLGIIIEPDKKLKSIGVTKTAIDYVNTLMNNQIAINCSNHTLVLYS